jgi:hypothetical protein
LFGGIVEGLIVFDDMHDGSLREVIFYIMGVRSDASLVLFDEYAKDTFPLVPLSYPLVAIACSIVSPAKETVVVGVSYILSGGIAKPDYIAFRTDDIAEYFLHIVWCKFVSFCEDLSFASKADECYDDDKDKVSHTLFVLV